MFSKRQGFESLGLLPQRRQNLLFSATYSDDIRQLADRLLDAPALIEVARRNTPAERVSQVIHPVDRKRKRELLSFMVGSSPHPKPAAPVLTSIGVGAPIDPKGEVLPGPNERLLPVEGPTLTQDVSVAAPKKGKERSLRQSTLHRNG